MRHENRQGFIAKQIFKPPTNHQPVPSNPTFCCTSHNCSPLISINLSHVMYPFPKQQKVTNGSQNCPLRTIAIQINSPITTSNPIPIPPSQQLTTHLLPPNPPTRRSRSTTYCRYIVPNNSHSSTPFRPPSPNLHPITHSAPTKNRSEMPGKKLLICCTSSGNTNPIQQPG